jgi:hypothetical protein
VRQARKPRAFYGRWRDDIGFGCLEPDDELSSVRGEKIKNKCACVRSSGCCARQSVPLLFSLLPVWLPRGYSLLVAWRGRGVLSHGIGFDLRAWHGIHMLHCQCQTISNSMSKNW